MSTEIINVNKLGIKDIEVREIPRMRAAYKISFNDRRINGDILLFFNKLEDLVKTDGAMKREFNLIYDSLITMGLIPQDIVVDLSLFHPNGVRLSTGIVERYSRNGIGSYLLDRVMEKAKENNAKAMTTVATTESMQNFALKKGFVESYEDHYYKIL